MVYYNEIDPGAAAWLGELIKQGHLPDGKVDTRSIVDVRASDLRGFRQCHFFAGIGGWALALRLAGWPDDREAWTGSCPCQPFSVAGAGAGADDPRHLWPAWFPLIRECRPASLFAEQVASADGRHWLDLVLSDLEGVGYAIGAFDLPAASVGAPHKRHRLWIVADTHSGGRAAGDPGERARAAALLPRFADADAHHLADAETGATGGMAHASDADRRSGERGAEAGARSDRVGRLGSGKRGEAGALADSDSAGRGGRGREGSDGARHQGPEPEPRSGSSGAWESVEWLPCIDGKARPIEPGTFPLADGVSARVGRLRGYGNAIVPQVAAEVIAAYLEVQP
jgi:DNA (cytosine-5)-methyltransferase 1